MHILKCICQKTEKPWKIIKSSAQEIKERLTPKKAEIK